MRSGPSAGNRRCALERSTKPWKAPVIVSPAPLATNPGLHPLHGNYSLGCRFGKQVSLHSWKCAMAHSLRFLAIIILRSSRRYSLGKHPLRTCQGKRSSEGALWNQQQQPRYVVCHPGWGVSGSNAGHCARGAAIPALRSPTGLLLGFAANSRIVYFPLLIHIVDKLPFASVMVHFF